MAAALVPLVLLATFTFDDLPPGAIVTTTLVQRMPTFAWRSAVAIVRVESNSMVAAVHKFFVRFVEAAPTVEEPDEAFAGALWAQGGQQLYNFTGGLFYSGAFASYERNRQRHLAAVSARDAPQGALTIFMQAVATFFYNLNF